LVVVRSRKLAVELAGVMTPLIGTKFVAKSAVARTR